MQNLAIDIKYIRKSFGDLLAVDDVSLSIPQGSFFAFLGPNGAGKSTTINMITGLAQMDSGSIHIGGFDLEKDYFACRKQIGLAPQEFNFDRFFTAQLLLEFQGGYFGMPRKIQKERAEHLLNHLGIWEKRNEYPMKLSGGMKRRLMLARALMHDPDILILDEPTAGVDVELRYRFWENIQELNSQGKTILLTTHYIEEAEKLSEDVAFIDHGKIIYQGKTSDAIQDSKNLEQLFLEKTGSQYQQGGKNAVS